MDDHQDDQNDRQRIEQMAALGEELRDLRASPLYEYRVANRYKPVIGEGNVRAAILFIGEAPGEAEARSGRPFVGASGRLLDELLRGIGLDRSTVYITNVVKDRPPDNRDPSPHEIELYTPILLRQIELIRPRVIVTLGRFAMEFVLDLLNIQPEEAKISKLHGRVLHGMAPHGPVALVPLFHPAVALYSTPRKATLVEDFQVLKQFV
jgi:DNA polymerase